MQFMIISYVSAASLIFTSLQRKSQGKINFHSLASNVVYKKLERAHQFACDDM